MWVSRSSSWRPKLLRGHMSPLTDPLAPEHFPNSHGQNANIKPETPVVDVPEIKRELLVPAEVITTVDLSPAGDTRFHIVPPGLLRSVALHILRQEWPWTNQTHLAFQHIPQLGQLIETKLPEKLAEPGQTSTIRIRFDLRAIAQHRAKLDDCKWSRFVAGAKLSEKDGRAHRDANRRCNDQKQWRQHDQSRRRDSNIQCAFADGAHRFSIHIAESESPFTGAGNPR